MRESTSLDRYSPSTAATARSDRAIAWEGRFLVVGFAAGEIPKIPLNLALLKGCQIVGVFWGAFVGREPQPQHSVGIEETIGSEMARYTCNRQNRVLCWRVSQ